MTLTLIYQLDMDILKLYLRTKNEFSGTGLSRLEYYRQTDTHTYTDTRMV